MEERPMVEKEVAISMSIAVNADATPMSHESTVKSF